jgi:hypothetical protein
MQCTALTLLTLGQEARARLLPPTGCHAAEVRRRTGTYHRPRPKTR